MNWATLITFLLTSFFGIVLMTMGVGMLIHIPAFPSTLNEFGYIMIAVFFFFFGWQIADIYW